MPSDPSNSRKKHLKLLLALGCSSAALAVTAAVFLGGWNSLSANWTLAPQIIAEADAPKVDKRYAALSMSVAPISGPMAKNKPGVEPESNVTETMASLGSTFAVMEPAAGPPAGTPGSTFEQSYGGQSFHASGGGTGRTWRGTVHPNNPNIAALNFPNYSPGGSGSGGGPFNPPLDCKSAAAKDDPNCKTPGTPGPETDNRTGNPGTGPGGSGGACVETTSNVDGLIVKTYSPAGCNQQNSNTDNTSGNGGGTGPGGATGGSCVETTSIINGQTVTTYSPAGCNEQTTNNGNPNGSGGSCVTTTSIINGQTVAVQTGDCGQQNANNDDAPPPPNGSPMCLSEEGCTPGGGPGGNSSIVVAVPEPDTLALLLIGLAGLFVLSRRRA